MVNSKKKGNRFELKIAKLLTEKTGVKWYRVPLSGAFATKQGTKDIRFKGDIYTDDKYYNNIVIECKATKDRITLEDIYNIKSKLWKWIQQSERESNNKQWLLFFKANNGKIFILENSKENKDKQKIIEQIISKHIIIELNSIFGKYCIYEVDTK